jgi:hypothetical protein
MSNGVDEGWRRHFDHRAEVPGRCPASQHRVHVPWPEHAAAVGDELLLCGHTHENRHDSDASRRYSVRNLVGEGANERLAGFAGAARQRVPHGPQHVYCGRTTSFLALT